MPNPKGMDWVADNARHPSVASMSLGGSRSISMNRAVKRLYEAGVVVCAAAGNENTDACFTSPASAPQVICNGERHGLKNSLSDLDQLVFISYA